MTPVRVSPLRQRMIEDMSIRPFGPKTQQDYVRVVAIPEQRLAASRWAPPIRTPAFGTPRPGSRRGRARRACRFPRAAR